MSGESGREEDWWESDRAQDPEDFRSHRWFAPTWMGTSQFRGAAELRVVQPIGQLCSCGEPISPEDVGYRIPRLNPRRGQPDALAFRGLFFTYYHLQCLLDDIGLHNGGDDDD